MIVTTKTYNNSDAREKEVKMKKREKAVLSVGKLPCKHLNFKTKKMLNLSHLIYNGI